MLMVKVRDTIGTVMENTFILTVAVAHILSCADRDFPDRTYRILEHY